MPNPEKIRETVNDIREHLYAWSQKFWASGRGLSYSAENPLTFELIDSSCGTTMCAAGFRCLRDGLRLVLDESRGDWAFVDSGGHEYDPQDFAAHVMGLDDEESYVMFVESVRITDVDMYAELAEAIIAGDLGRARALCAHESEYRARLNVTR